MAITVNATLKDANGAAIVGGFLRVTLCGYGALIPRVAGTNLIASTKPIQVQSNGAGLATFTPVGNDVILPAGTFYSVQVLDPDQNPVQTNDYQFTGAGVIDLSNLAPYNPPPVSIPPVSGIVPILAPLTINNPTAGQVLATVTPQYTNPNAFYEVVASGKFTITAAPGAAGISLYATTVGGVKFGSGMNINPINNGRPFIIRMRFATVAGAYWSGEVEGDGSTAAVFAPLWGGPIADANNIAKFTVEADGFGFTGSVTLYHLVPRVTW